MTRILVFTPTYRDLTKEEFIVLVKAKANYSCEVCGIKEEETEKILYKRNNKIMKRNYIQAHHIDENRENNKLENGLYVCVYCHNKIHEKEKNKKLIERNKNGQASKAGFKAWEKINSMNKKERQKFLSDRAKKAWEVRKNKYGPTGRKAGV